MKVPYQLLQQIHRAPAYGLLIPHDTRLALHWAIQFQSLEPSLHPTQSGWLLVTRKPMDHPPVGYHILQELHPGLFIPADALLVPGLLADEAGGLTRSQKVIILPGPCFYSASHQSIPLRSLIFIPEIEESHWKSLPTPPKLADQLHTLEYSPSQQTLLDKANELLKPGGMGTPDPKVDGKLPRPPGSNPLKYLVGAFALGIGKAIGGLGQVLGIKKLAGFGAGLIAGSVNLAPRLAEGLLGKQEAALRALLRKFQMGHIEEALRRALPVGGETSRGASIYDSDRLPVNNLRFNVSNLFSFGGVSSSVWLGGDDIMLRLSQEYRKQAELAEQRGDHRRAAYIYVKLLNDLNSAAAVLARGGLHREAALIYLRLNEELKAADQFEKAGLYDRAIELYRRNNRYDLSGILLSSLKLDDEALAEFILGADRMVRATGDYLGAGKLLDDYAHRTDLACDYYAKGWKARPLGSPVPCAMQLVKIYCQLRKIEDVQSIFEEGLQYFKNTTDDKLASTFINGILTETNIHNKDTIPQELQEELKDQAVQHFALRLRAGSMGQKYSNALLRTLLVGKNWSVSEYSDADFAYRNACLRVPSDENPLQHVRKITLPANDPKPTCVTMAENKGWLFVGYESGEIFRVDLADGSIMTVSTSYREKPIALSVSPAGYHLHELRNPIMRDNKPRLLTYTASVQNYRFIEEIILNNDDVWLSPYVLTDHNNIRHIVYGDGDDLCIRQYPNGLGLKYPRTLADDAVLRLVIPASTVASDQLHMLGFDGYRLYDLVAGEGQLKVHTSNAIGWGFRFATQEHGVQPMHWHSLANELLIAGVGANGMIYLTKRGASGIMSTHVSTGDEEYFAVCLIDRENMVATARNGLHWYRIQSDGLRLSHIQEMVLGVTEACYVSPHDLNVIVIKQDSVLFLPRS